jgi:plasmid rolling circle replication initiator protein Rep
MTTKQYSSKKEHCEGLLASMDRTEDQMIRLLEQTLLPESVIRQKYENAQKEKAKAAAKKPKADDKPKAE